MDAITAVTTITQVLETIFKLEPEIVQGFTDLQGFISALYQRFTGQQISADDLATLEAKVDELHAELQEPLNED